MDFITKQIEENISLSIDINDKKVHHQIRVEYSLMLMFSYLWNKNLEEKGFGKRKRLIESIQKPTLGTIINVAKDLDLMKEFFKEETSIIFDYIDIRNNTIGHGYCFGEKVEECISQLDEYYQSIVNLKIPILSNDTNIIYVNSYDGDSDLYNGFIYTYEGSIRPWTCSKKIQIFEINNIYASYQLNEYFRISPFIYIEHPRKFYTFISVEELLLGKLKYNRIDEQGQKIITWDEIYNEFSASDGIRRRTVNKTIINEFKNNYKEFIDVGIIKNEINEFLIGKKRNSSVCATIWGHGGVGKTATVQNICREISNNTQLKKQDKFDYIIFLSAKDRMFDTQLVAISEIQSAERIINFEDLIVKINKIIFNEDNNTNYQKIVDYTGRILLIIDDYETFIDEDKQKITNFIQLLNTNYHKILITTRNKFLVIGSEIRTDELNQDDTILFLLNVIEKYYNYNQSRINELKKEINNKETIQIIHKITSGRPLFIFVFANYLVQAGSVKIALNDKQVKKISSSSDANEFLFGKIFEHLKSDRLAQDIYSVIGLLTPEDKLTSLITHIKYILSIDDENETNFTIALEKLIDLKIIEVFEQSFYKVYSNEVLKLMKTQFEKHSNKRYFRNRFNKLEKYITKDTGEALLNNANNARFSEKSEEFVISTYKEIINLKDVNENTKLQSLLNLTDYLFSNRGNKELAVKIFENFSFLRKYPECTIMNAQYLWSLKDEKYKKNAIALLSDYFHNLKKINIKIEKEKRIQVLALLVLRKSLYWLEKGINENEYKNIYNIYGNILFNEIKGIDVNKISSNIRQDILTSLLSLTDICLKIQEMKKHAKEISSYVLSEIDKAPSHIKNQFKNKLKLIEKKWYIPQKKQILGQKAVENKIYRGSIKDYGLKDGFGFIVVDELDKDVYFNSNNLINCQFDDLYEYDIVEVIIKVWKGRYSIINNNYSAKTVKLIAY